MSREGKLSNWPLWAALVLVTAGIAVILLLAFPQTLKSDDNDDDTQIRDTEPVMGAYAPEFSLFNLANEQIQLSDFKGHPVLLNFWATWCAPCRIEMPAIQDKFEKYSEEGLIILAINYAEPLKDVQAFKNELDLTFEFLLDPVADTQRLYRIRGYPTSVFIDSDGIIQMIHIGMLSESQLDDYLTQIELGF